MPTSDESELPREASTRGASKFEQASKDKKNASVVRETLAFLGNNKKWWLLPVLVTFVGVGILVAFFNAAATPEIYTFF